MAYIRKTTDEWNIYGNYGFGFEHVTCEVTRKEAITNLKAYRENEPGISFKVIKNRVRKENL